jgi:AhpD family alkylhydroperoxidase
MRASQINGCAFCIDMHSKDARVNGETEQRLYALSAWRETSFFTNRWLELAPALTLTDTKSPLRAFQAIHADLNLAGNLLAALANHMAI